MVGNDDHSARKLHVTSSETTVALELSSFEVQDVGAFQCVDTAAVLRVSTFGFQHNACTSARMCTSPPAVNPEEEEWQEMRSAFKESKAAYVVSKEECLRLCACVRGYNVCTFSQRDLDLRVLQRNLFGPGQKRPSCGLAMEN
ncbi:hypothetical protein EYF80_009761 [Liparis tanakae]|uniref:Uncharacterized protein n=1 Tax=Liparis tanakae TaxID=230148 RepID=A0A4Z2IQX8_9TELE|nr:hypothetical protein EYF80_009761 [Liparis tanakae]